MKNLQPSARETGLTPPGERGNVLTADERGKADAGPLGCSRHGPAQLGCRRFVVRVRPWAEDSAVRQELGRRRKAPSFPADSGGSRRRDHLDEDPGLRRPACLRQLVPAFRRERLLHRPLGAATSVSCPYSHRDRGLPRRSAKARAHARAFLVQGPETPATENTAVTEKRRH